MKLSWLMVALFEAFTRFSTESDASGIDDLSENYF